MPQMSPLNWISLMLFFLLIYIIINILNYFSLIYTNKLSFKKNKTINWNWKW
uniref:ATP synthase complex subunit 8 n=1 Tax=Scraptia sp. SCR01 TaxID=1205582 RepID=A0A0S2MS90_9CUCU|nr:ATP synthase F0 subunit 8 [Scraptia sp. SCR01]